MIIRVRSNSRLHQTHPWPFTNPKIILTRHRGTSRPVRVDKKNVLHVIDLIYTSGTLQDHKDKVKEVLEFAVKKVKYLGFIIPTRHSCNCLVHDGRRQATSSGLPGGKLSTPSRSRAARFVLNNSFVEVIKTSPSDLLTGYRMDNDQRHLGAFDYGDDFRFLRDEAQLQALVEQQATQLQEQRQKKDSSSKSK
ncbi:hypothetical protein XA68_13703 [Ophiocordyceps unilateralis]|uniref:Uncharacterized protein n=1 Tax=Ophiocordyceps unilateralis TaxID=268505 RepID=A0A2A9PBX4_OPHUN|nr:hypothetical protein XA68_13703 [Ophiocordyceps unilateralis]